MPRDVGCRCGWRQPEDNHNEARHNWHLAEAIVESLKTPAGGEER